MPQPTLSALLPYEDTSRGFCIIDEKIGLVQNARATMHEPRLELTEGAFRVTMLPLQRVEQEYLAKNKRMIARRILPTINIPRPRSDGDIWEIVKQSYAEQTAPDDAAGEALTSLLYERERRASFINNIVRPQAPGSEAARRFKAPGLFSMKGVLYTLEKGTTLPRLVTTEGTFSMRKQGMTRQLLDAHDEIVYARARRLQQMAHVPIDMLLWPGPEQRMAARPDHSLVVEQRERDIAFLQVHLEPYALRWWNGDDDQEYLMDGCTAGYVVRSHRGGFSIENSPMIITPRPYAHPFAYGRDRLCFNDTVVPNRWTRNGIAWGAVMNARSSTEEREVAFKLAFPAAEFVRTAHLGYGRKSLPYHRLDTFNDRKTTKDEILRQGVRIYDNARFERSAPAS